MNPPAVSATSRIRQWASGYLADYDARQPGTMFAKGVIMDVAQAYELPSAVAELRRDRGEPLRAGQIILTGSIPKLIPVTEDCVV
jgi:hypothetical protein